MGDAVQVVDLGLDGVYPTLQVWDDPVVGGVVKWLCADGVTWRTWRYSNVYFAINKATTLAPLVTAALASGERLSHIRNDEG